MFIKYRSIITDLPNTVANNVGTFQLVIHADKSIQTA